VWQGGIEKRREQKMYKIKRVKKLPLLRWPVFGDLSSWLLLIKGIPLLQPAGDCNRNRGERHETSGGETPFSRKKEGSGLAAKGADPNEGDSGEKS
jgi:hypothetical protein